MYQEESYFYELKNKKSGIKTIEGAKNIKSIGVVRGGVHEHFLIENNFDNIVSVNSYNQCLLMLKTGRVDSIIAMRESIYSEIGNVNLNSNDIFQVPILLPIKGYVGGYLSFSKNISDESINKWQEALDSIIISNKYYELQKLYMYPKK